MQSERTGIVYCAQNEVNLKSYIGQTVLPLERRKQTHLTVARGGSGNHFHRALRKHGANAFTWHVLEDGIPEANLGEREQHWITTYDTFHSGYNMTGGGEVSPTTQPEIAAKAGKTLSATMKEKSARGEHQSQRPEWRAKRSATLKEQASRGEHPMQNPDVAKRNSAVQKANRRQRLKDAGQQFWIEAEKAL